MVARNINPPGHTLPPRYVRGKHGVVYRRADFIKSAASRAFRRSPVLHHGSPSFRFSSSMRRSPSLVCPPILRNFCILRRPLSVRISCWNR